MMRTFTSVFRGNFSKPLLRVPLAVCPPVLLLLKQSLATSVFAAIAAVALAPVAQASSQPLQGSPATRSSLPPPASAPASRPHRTLDTLNIRVDPRVELMSIVCRLAGFREYNIAPVSAYTRDVDACFGPHRDHPIVERLHKGRSQCGIGYDAPMSLAVHLVDADSLEIATAEPYPRDLDARWRKADLPGFLADLRDFASRTDFPAFHRAHQELYDQAAATMRAALAGQGDLEWFDTFFGQPAPGPYHIILGMLNGGASYGPRATIASRHEMYSVVGIWQVNSRGLPDLMATSGSLVPLFIHEFGHSYVNPIVEKHKDAFSRSGPVIYNTCRERMEKQAYGNWTTMICESLVRACGIRYLYVSSSPAAAERAAKYETSQGFLWVPSLAEILGQYEQERQRHPTFESFMPRIAQFFDDYARQPSTTTSPAP